MLQIAYNSQFTSLLPRTVGTHTICTSGLSIKRSANSMKYSKYSASRSIISVSLLKKVKKEGNLMPSCNNVFNQLLANVFKENIDI